MRQKSWKPARIRRSLWEQAHAFNYAINSLIQDRGKMKRQFNLMDDSLKNVFLTLQSVLPAAIAEYETFLVKTGCEDEKKAKHFLPEPMFSQLPVVKAARENNLDLV